jgi:hypothetical protein
MYLKILAEPTRERTWRFPALPFLNLRDSTTATSVSDWLEQRTALFRLPVLTDAARADAACVAALAERFPLLASLMGLSLGAAGATSAAGAAAGTSGYIDDSAPVASKAPVGPPLRTGSAALLAPAVNRGESEEWGVGAVMRAGAGPAAGAGGRGPGDGPGLRIGAGPV